MYNVHPDLLVYRNANESLLSFDEKLLISLQQRIQTSVLTLFVCVNDKCTNYCS